MIVEFTVPTRVANLLNKRVHWRIRSQLAQKQRADTKACALAALGRRRLDPRSPKHVQFVVVRHRLFDDDAIPGAVKSLRDGLIDARIIDGDGPKSGHRFEYGQVHGLTEYVSIWIEANAQAAR